jgi:ribosomal protein S18 acetylase RimI-like enzyme
MTNSWRDLDAIHTPVWSSVSSRHASLGKAEGAAVAYDMDVSVLGGLREPSEAALTDLGNLVGPGAIIGLMGPLDELPLGAGWRQLARPEIHQMVCEQPAPFFEQEFIELGPGDVDDMIELVAATEPGPFAKRTIEMGTYLGVRDGGKLVAMAGERLKPEGWTEISGVCTDASARGKGYAASLVGELLRRIVARGERSFLHVVKGSPSEAVALGVYERLGFRTARDMCVNVVRNESGS